MTPARKGLVLAAIQCLLALSVSGKLLYDRSTCPRIWVKTAQWDPNLPIRGRYLALRLAPDSGAKWYPEINGALVLFFVPERKLPFEAMRFGPDAPELWAEVTIPHKGPPRPIRLAIRKAGQMELLDIR